MHTNGNDGEPASGNRLADERTISRKGLIAGAAAAAGAAGLAAAPSVQAESDKGLVGSWFLTIVATDPPLGRFNGLISFHDDGVVTEARRYYLPAPPPLGELLETSGHGAWKPNGNRTYEAFFRFLLQAAPPSNGNPVGTDNIRLALALDAASDTLSGTFESNIMDNTNTVVFTVRGSVDAERIAV